MGEDWLCTMKSALCTAIVGCCLVVLSGCGTFGNLFRMETGQTNVVYGGVRSDLSLLRGSWAATAAGPDAWFRRVILSTDLVLSAVADTVTLPYTIPLERSNRAWGTKLEMKNEPTLKEADEKTLRQ